MFKKKDCQKCGRKMKGDYDFCPYCGNSAGKNKTEDWGMLGKDDFFNDVGKIQTPFFGKINETMISKMLNSVMKMLEKEMQKGENIPQKREIPANVRLVINGKEISLNNAEKKPEKKIKEAKSKSFSKEDVKKFLKLKRVEPKSEIRRFSDKVVYEVELPGVKSIEDVSVLKLENSVEIRAIAKEKAYVKILPINMPLINYSLSEEKLILELKA